MIFSTETKNRALKDLAKLIDDNKSEIIAQNKIDLDNAQNIDPTLIDRLKVDEKKVDGMVSAVEEIISDEGFVVHQEKTTVMGRGGRQEVTGLIVNNEGEPRTPREVRRMLRAAINNLQKGKLFKEGENIHTLIGYASFIYSTDPEEGQKYLNELASLPEGVGTEAYVAQFSEKNNL